MKAEDIIEGLNQSIEDKRDALKIKATGHLVLQRTVTPHQTFKAYKEYKFVVWFVKDLDDAEKAIAKESMVASKMRGQGEKTIMEDGLNI